MLASRGWHHRGRLPSLASPITLIVAVYGWVFLFAAGPITDAFERHPVVGLCHRVPKPPSTAHPKRFTGQWSTSAGAPRLAIPIGTMPRSGSGTTTTTRVAMVDSHLLEQGFAGVATTTTASSFLGWDPGATPAPAALLLLLAALPDGPGAWGLGIAALVFAASIGAFVYANNTYTPEILEGARDLRRSDREAQVRKMLEAVVESGDSLEKLRVPLETALGRSLDDYVRAVLGDENETETEGDDMDDGEFTEADTELATLLRDRMP